MSSPEKFYYQPSIEANKQKLQHIHDVASLALGVGSGILTLESLNGFLFYLAGITATNVLFYIICGEGRPGKYFKSPIQEVFLNGVFSNLAGFIMMWCLVYALVKSSL
ncbi:ER membrane protein complex subunit 6 [Candida viswanathii]|uniref:ER membrane protein complex subunit 6 n=1 Tax=Candida viswanathii TaxID=5486 RepID=A0A367YAP0_9ASCO|nr:ER membrane protein complex subunit 6 [Candida viswanathii]